MIRIAICDDDEHTASHVEDIIRDEHYDNLDIGIFSNGDTLIQYLNAESEGFHIYLMDIQMSGRSGIETASIIRSMDADAVIIFVTDYPEYVYQVFETLPFRFLRKPIDPKMLILAVSDAISHLHTRGKLFFFWYQRKSTQLPYRDIIYFESLGRKMVLHTPKEEYVFYDSISGILAVLDTSLFCRIHGSFVVNMDYIRSIQKNGLLLNNEVLLPVSKRFQASLKQAHLHFMERRF